MSFVFAVKHTFEFDGFEKKLTSIYSDTKVSLDGTSKETWGDQTWTLVNKYGLIKSIIVGPKCCVSFAGNNIAHAHKLLSQLYAKGMFSEDELLELAFNIHLNAPVDEIEFIIAIADEEDETELVCIKDGEMRRNCASAWIGSQRAFSCMQECRLGKPENSKLYAAAFNHAMRCCRDDSVGGFSIIVQYDSSEKQFIYPCRLESEVVRAQEVLSGMQVNLTGSAEEGACSLYYHPSSEYVAIEISQADLMLLYTKKYRLESKDSFNLHMQRFLLRIVITSDTQTII